MPKYNDFELDIQQVQTDKQIEGYKTTYYTLTQCHCEKTGTTCNPRSESCPTSCIM